MSTKKRAFMVPFSFALVFSEGGAQKADLRLQQDAGLVPHHLADVVDEVQNILAGRCV